MIQVHHYGLHFAAGSVGFLLQRGSEQSVYDVPSPFTVIKGTGRCPHKVDLAYVDESDHALLEDPLARWMAAPRGVAVVDAPTELIERLSQIYWPTRPLMTPAWSYNRVWRQELACTNFCPWILVGATVAQVDLFRAAEQFPRPVLAVSADTFPVPGGVRLETELSETDLPDPMALQRLGAWAAYRRLKRL